ncbi:MAG: methyl-accepting chemotaxis protein [Pseudanabaena sp. Salubria-1]|jgi:methyl-accepting chemotaxis protein PixJ|nr:methyl-accepting chemotaxis protein [Pseudanabaena sp. Salubria-1]
MRLIMYQEACRGLSILLETKTYFHSGAIMMTAQYQAALQSYAEGRYEEAMKQFSELLHEDPRNPKLHIWLGATFRKAGKIDYAKTQYQQVLTLTDDPDLLDLASTSLAQIQNKLANISQTNKPQKVFQKDVETHSPAFKESSDADKAQAANYRALQLKDMQNVGSNINGGSSSKSISYILDHDDSTTGDLAILANPSSINVAIKPKVAVNALVNGNGIVPPPPAIAAQYKSQQVEQAQEEITALQEPLFTLETSFADDETMMVEDAGIMIGDLEDITDKAPTSIFSDTIANIQEASESNKQRIEFPPPESVFCGWGIDSQDNDFNQELSTSQGKASARNDVLAQGKAFAGNDVSAIALEDVFKFSSVGQKITLWGALVATIPAIALGVVAYQVGDGLLLSKVKQAQQSEAIALASVTRNFLKQQLNDVEVLQKLLVSNEIGQNTLLKLPTTSPNDKAANPLSSLPIAQQRQYKQQLTNRLNLYSQAYPNYNSIALFSTNGELIAQSSTSKTLQTLNPNILSKALAADTVFFGNPVVEKDGVYLYVARSIKSSVSQKVNMILQVEIPVKNLENDLTIANKDANGNKDFYVIDSSNKYITSSQIVKVGEDASTSFAGLQDLRTSKSSGIGDTVRLDRNGKLFAYATVPDMKTYDMLTWDVLTTIDKTKAITGNQSLLLVIGIGIAATPLLVATIAYALSRKLSSRLKDIRAALRDIRQGTATLSLGSLSVEGNDELSDISLSINKMSEQFQTMMQKQEQEKQNLQLQVVKLFNVLAKLAREEKHEAKDTDFSDENILRLGKKVRSEIVQRHAEVESYRQQKEDLQDHLMQMLKDVQALADGDLTVSTQSVDGSLPNVAIFFDDVIRGLQNIVGQVKSSANQVNFSLGQNEQAIANLANVSQRQVDIVTRSLNTMQMSKLSATKIVNNSQQVLQSSQRVVEKLSDSDRSIDAVMSKVGELQNVVATTAKRVKNLGVVSQKIAKAISSINEIAIKTNFLAINASLEASRSNDANSGFVMIAEEVGELAARSVTATKEVEVLLRNIQIETKAVMSSVESGSNQLSESNTLAIAAKDSLQQIAQISQQIDGLMITISDATTSQAQTTEGVANLMNDISHMARRTLASSSEASKLIKATRGYSGELQQSLAHFKTR